MSAKEILGIAIVGCGQIATHHVDAIACKLTGKICIRAFCDPSEERRNVLLNLSKTNNLLDNELISPRQYGSFDDLLKDESFFSSNIDIVFIAVPHDLHETLALHALQ